MVFATGSRPMLSGLPNANDGRMVDAREFLAGEVPLRPGRRVVVVAGEHYIQALSTAEFLADKGCEVEVLTEALYAGAQLDGGTLELLYGRLLGKVVTITPLTSVKSIDGSAMTVANSVTNQERSIHGVDLVVAACGGQADDSLYREAREGVAEVDLIGDALAPRRLMDAILDGARAGRRI